MQENFTENELKYILLEFNRLENSREEKLKPEVIKEWIASFLETGYTGEHTCRMIRKVRMYSQNFKLKFADFTSYQNDCSGMDIIIPKKLLPVIDDKAVTDYELQSIKYSSMICARVREELNISYIDFLNLKDEYNYQNSESFIEHLKINPHHITCGKLSERQISDKRGTSMTLGEAIRNSF